MVNKDLLDVNGKTIIDQSTLDAKLQLLDRKKQEFQTLVTNYVATKTDSILHVSDATGRLQTLESQLGNLVNEANTLVQDLKSRVDLYVQTQPESSNKVMELESLLADFLEVDATRTAQVNVYDHTTFWGRRYLPVKWPVPDSLAPYLTAVTAVMAMLTLVCIALGLGLYEYLRGVFLSSSPGGGHTVLGGGQSSQNSRNSRRSRP
jgi:hypothetical protein